MIYSIYMNVYEYMVWMSDNECISLKLRGQPKITWYQEKQDIRKSRVKAWEYEDVLRIAVLDYYIQNRPQRPAVLFLAFTYII